jgi:STE24 endopeptidase
VTVTFEIPSLSSIEPIVTLRLFLLLRFTQYVVETYLSWTNRTWWSNRTRQAEAAEILGISPADMQKTVAYSGDRYNLARISACAGILAALTFIGFGGLGWVEDTAQQANEVLGGGSIIEGLLFIGILTLLSQLLSLPFAVYSTFVIEERYGYNKQTVSGFVSDLLKGLVLGMILGSIILSVILWIMESMGASWWIYAWAALTVFSLMTAWIYPSILAPLFNKFTPLEEGELKRAILSLADKTGFKADGLFVMDASKRSGHANAYFTGIFGKKRIVLFDTLVNSMNTKEVTAVLAHELGHFKLHHVRTGMIRGLIFSFIIFAGIGAMLGSKNFYLGFGLTGVSNYGGLVVFSLWFGLIEFYLQPLQTWFSRRNEFAADDFAKKTLGSGLDLVSALKKLREKSSIMPIAHPLYSAMYYSHPPMLERIKTLETAT